MALIEVKNAVRTYQMGDETFYALHDVSFSIEEGEFVAIMGTSGSGKSTFLRSLNRMNDRVATVNGKIWFHGLDVNKPNINVYELRKNVEDSYIQEERYRRAREALKIVGLDKKENNMPSQMSGGQQQRVAIARAIVNDAPLILADEPTGNLDTKTSIDVMEFFVNLNKNLGKTVVLVTHEPDIAEYTKRILKFKDGRIVSDMLKDEWMKHRNRET